MRIGTVVKGIGFVGYAHITHSWNVGAVAMAGGNPHVAEAIAHAEGAAEHGAWGHADALVGSMLKKR